MGEPEQDGPEELVELGEVMGTHGAAGDLRVKAHNPDSGLLQSLAEVHVRLGERSRIHRVAWCRPHGKGLLMRLSDVTGRDAARAIYGASLCVPRGALPAADPDEYYVVDLIGAQVQLGDGTPVGEVTGYQPYPTVDVLLVRTSQGTLELPLLDPYVVDVDPDAGRVVAAHLEDLE